MSSFSTTTPPRRAPLLAALAVLAALPAPAAAQDPAEDPWADPQPESAPIEAPFDAADDEELILDPELDATPPESAPAAVEPPAPAASATVRALLHTRWGLNTSWALPSQEILEGTQIGLVEATYRRSESAGFAVGLRARHAYATRRPGSPDPAGRYALDVAPVAAYGDATLTDGVHLRAGYQILKLGRFDVWSATNFLAVYDLRSGPATIPEAADIAQPALRWVVDRLPWLTLEATYVPFFVPHRVDVWGTDYSLLSPLARDLDRQNDPALTAARADLESALGRSTLASLGRSTFGALAPEPSLAEPQGALRATVRGAPGELSLTAGTALERLPALRIDPAVQQSLEEGTPFPEGDPFSFEHPRFFVFSADAATDLGPIQLGAEAAYMAGRTLLAGREGFLPEPARTDMAHGALRAEYLRGQRLLLAVEAFASVALDDPADPDRRWVSLEQGRFWRGLAAIARLAPEKTPFRFELAAVAFSGPTYLLAPRVEWEALERLYLELGAVLVGGPTPQDPTDPTLSLGGLFSSTDQVFLGLRWVP